MVKTSDAAEESPGLTGVAHDEGGLGIGLSGLVQEFDCGHLAAAFALLQAVGQDDKPAVAAFDSWVDLEHQASPDAGEAIGTEGRAVKEVQQAAIAARPQPQGPDKARD